MTVPHDDASRSISIRLRRQTVEYAYVNVPVEGDLVRPDEQGVGGINLEELSRRCVEMGQDGQVLWYREDQRIEPHPLQKAPEPGERRFPF